MCQQNRWELAGTRFYTGIPDAHQDPRWHSFWTSKLLTMKRSGVDVYSRPLRYRQKLARPADGRIESVLAPEEKGIDVRIAIDVIKLALKRDYDVAVIFSQDQDLSELCKDIRDIAREQDRWIKIASAYPWSDTCRNSRGLRDSDWIRIIKSVYDGCIDPHA